MERLVLFARTPRLHEVKTRLTPPLTPERALLLYEAMLSDQTRFLKSLSGDDRSCEVRLDTEQGDGDLGARMHRTLSRELENGAARAAILGADAPTVPRALIDGAFAHLRQGADAVIIPADDGGYVLVGASRSVPSLFEAVPWGTPEVAEVTRRRARESGLVLAETAPWFDVDVADDLSRLARELAGDRSRAPATAAALAAFGLYSS